LDDVVLWLLALRRDGVPLTPAMLIDALVKEIGPAARTAFEALIIRGETVEPLSNAFGPCFERRARTDSISGRTLNGFEWVRVASVPEAHCRTW
jgi:hypothetical protein